MNAKLSLLFITLSISLAALFSGTDPSYSCGPGFDYEKYRISYVDPDLLSDSLYQSFYRTVLREHQAADNYWDTPHEEFRGIEWPTIKDEENIRDWQSYFGGTVSEKSIHDLIYRSNRGMVEEMLGKLEKGEPLPAHDTIIIRQDEWQTPDTLFIGEILRAVESRHDIPFLRYLLYANECSQYAGSSDPWQEPTETEETTQRQDTVAMLALVEQGLALHKDCRSDFLKLRYAYQIVRTARYAGDFERAVALYDKLVPPNPIRSPIRFWTLGHKAGAERKMGNMPLSNYYFSQVFDSCEGERETSVRDFRISENDEDGWNELYGLARNNHERGTLWMLRGFKAQGLNFDYMREMYKVEPNSPQLAMALLRELHRIETYLYDDMETRDYTVRATGMSEGYDYDKDTLVKSNVDNGYWYADDYKRHLAPGRSWDTIYYYETPDGEDAEPQLVKTLSGRDYVAAFRRFVLETAKEGRVMEPALWYMVAGYIDMMDGDNELAGECLGEAEHETRGNYDLEHQIQLLNYLREVKSAGKVGADIEGNITETLRWFREKQNRNRHSRYNKVMAALGQEYLSQNDVPKAILAFNAANDPVTRNVLLDIYSTPEEIEELQQLVEKGAKSEYEQMLVDSFSLRRDDLLDLRGTRLMRQGKFEEALQLFEQVAPPYWSAPPDTFIYYSTPANYRLFYSNMDTARLSGMNIVSLSYWDEYNPDSVARSIPHTVQYTKLTFARTAVGLLQQIKGENTAQRAKASFRLAMLLFNTPYWGYADGVWLGEMLMEIRYYYYSATSYPFNIQGVAERMGAKEKEFMDEYGSRHMARNYFERAMSETTDRELAARCLYMIDLCNKQPQTTLHPVAALEDQDRTGYNLLITKYRDTRFAKRILSQCSVYKYFRKG